jgi:hypothetical protein
LIAVTPFQRAAATALLAVFFVQGLFIAKHTSPTTDEVPFHMVNGYLYLKTGDFRMNPSSPALIREWMALPWLFMKPKLDLSKSSWKEAETQPFAEEFMWRDNRAAADKLIFSSRMMVLFLGTLLGGLIFLWAAQLYGPAGGFTALALYAFSPSFLAHASIATTDAGTAFLFTAASFAFWGYLTRGGRYRFVLFSLFLGLTFAAKISMLIFGPVFLLAAGMKRGARWFVLVAPTAALASLFVVWAVYAFEFKPLLWEGVPRTGEKLEMIDSLARKTVADPSTLKRLALELPVPAPSYILAVAGIARHHTGELRQYFFGRWGMSHPWFLYFFLFAVKMTIPFLLLLAVRGYLFFADKGRQHEESLVLLYPAAVFFLFMCFEKTGHGHRYLLPIVATLTVWAGGAGQALWRGGRGPRVLLAALIGAHAFVSLSAFPEHLSYFNRLAGGSSNGWRLVRDSDTDWGQGLKPLAKYLKRREIDEVALEYFGTTPPDFYGIRSRQLSEEERRAPARAVYALSVNYLEHTDWASSRTPDAVVGGSIFVYDQR